jgi:MOSC domain-containing protein YiiM
MHKNADGRRYHTALFKLPLTVPVMLRRSNLDGDEQADLRHHGGADKAVCCFPVEHYAAVEKMVGQSLPSGAFGENFTVRCMTEDLVCLGDRYRAGEAIVEVSQPRQPCHNLGNRFNRDSIPREMIELGLSGFYLRVIEEGMVDGPGPMPLLERPNPGCTIAALNLLMFSGSSTPEEFRAALALPQLSEAWRKSLSQKLAQKML